MLRKKQKLKRKKEKKKKESKMMEERKKELDVSHDWIMPGCPPSPFTHEAV